jgi:hypothetical protein
MTVRHIATQLKGTRRFGWLGPALCLAAVACSGSGIGQALADSGDFAAIVDGATDYLLPTQTCSNLKTPVGIDAELILACSIGGRPAVPGANDSPCDIVSGLTNTNAGLAVGQCLTPAYPTPFVVVGPTTEVLESNTGIRATAAGSNLALGDRDQISVTSASGGGSVLGLIDVQAGQCDPGECPNSCGSIPVVQNQSACTQIRTSLGASVAAQPPALSHALFFDLEQTGTDGVLKVAVCDDYQWTCRTPGTQVASTSYRGQVPFSIVDTPVCVRFTRSTRCP